MGAIFLSYAREDRDCAQKLAKVLEAAHHEVWWDRHLDGGEEFSAEIEAALGSSDVVLVTWSKESVKSRWVRDEAAVGAETHKLIPVTIDGSLPPMGFRQFHTLDLTGWRGAKRDQRTTELLQSVERRVGSNTTSSLSSASPPKRPRAVPSPKLIWVAAAFVFLIVGVGGAYMWQRTRNSTGDPLKPAIALVPFTTASKDEQLSTIASQTRDSLADTFSQSGLPLNVLNSVPQRGTAKADFLLSGDLSRNADKIVATVRLDETAHGVTVFTHEVEASQDDARYLAERIGAQIAAALTGKDSLITLDRRHPLDPAIMAELLAGDFLKTDPLQSYQQSKRAAEKAPTAQSAQLALAYNGAFALSELPRDERRETLSESRQAADRAIALGPGFGDAYSTWCLLHSEALRAECEDRLRAAKRIDPDAPWVNTFLSHLLRGVGRFDEATQLARLSQTHDVYVPQKIAWLLRVLEYSGERDDAQQLYEQGVRWWPEFKPFLLRNRLVGLIIRGDFDALQQLEQTESAAKVIPGYAETAPLAAALKSRSLSAARQACPAAADYVLKVRCMLAFAKLGDENAAYAIAGTYYPRRVGRNLAETEQIWLNDPDGGGDPEFITSPAMAAFRRDPRYLKIVERIGLLAYWRSGRPPDFCRTNPEPICPQLLGRH